MSQESTNLCPHCQAANPPGQSHCVRCGAARATNRVPPTVLAGGSSPQHNVVPPTVLAGDSPQHNAVPPTVQASAPNASITLPPPPVSDPYNSGAAYNPYGNVGTPPPPAYGTPYGQGYPPAPPYPNYTPPKKKTSPWLIFGLVTLVVVLLICGGGAWGVARILGFGSPDGQAKSSPKGINFTYASVNFTVTSIEQAKSFDDAKMIYGSSSATTRYIRLNTHEKYPEGDHLFFQVSYFRDFKLIMPDGKSIDSLEEKYYTSHSPGEERDNWMDFKVENAVENLSQLVLKVGDEGTGEMVMSIPLKDNPDLSKYQDKAITPNQAFSYASMNWTLKSATQSFSFGGKQVKKGEVVVTASLVANNPTGYKYYMKDFLALIGPDKKPTEPNVLESNMYQFFIIQPHATNVSGTAVFHTKLSPTGQYVLYFAAGQDNAWPEKQIPLQF